ncbi:hypothetical protein JCM9957A_44440 [Kineosporia succinea]
MLDSRRSRAKRATHDLDPAAGRRKRRAAVNATLNAQVHAQVGAPVTVGSVEGSSFFADDLGDPSDPTPTRPRETSPRETGPRETRPRETSSTGRKSIRVAAAPPEERLSRADLRARRERMEKRRRRRALQRQLTFGLIGRETDPEAATVAIPRLEETDTGSIKVARSRSERKAMETGALDLGTVSSADTGSIIIADITVDDPTPTGEISTRRSLRGKRPQTGRRSSRGPIGRAASNKRAWLGAVAIALTVAVPGGYFLDRAQSEPTQEAALTSEGNTMPTITADRSTSPTSEELKKNQERLGKATATKTKKAASKTTSADKSKSPSASRTTTTTDDAPTSSKPGGTTQVGLANLSDKASGLGWASGVYMPGSNASNQAAFAQWRGTGLDVVVDWPARSNWDELVNPDWLYAAWKGTSYTKSFGFPPFPEDGSTLSECATGAYNDKWKQIAKNIKAAGLDDTTVIRLGWEFNGNWYAWAAGDAEAFKGCWQQVVGAAESVAPALTWDWNVNRGVGSGLADATKAYPGDEYVDIVGVDSYDMYPGAVDQASWNEHLNGKQGLKYWANFAKSHGKKISVPEWGVYPGTASEGSNGGDNPYYIAKMNAWFQSLGSQLAYESYFNEDAPYYAGSIYGSGQNPNAGAKYQELFTK